MSKPKENFFVNVFHNINNHWNSIPFEFKIFILFVSLLILFFVLFYACYYVYDIFYNDNKYNNISTNFKRLKKNVRKYLVKARYKFSKNQIKEDSEIDLNETNDIKSKKCNSKRLIKKLKDNSYTEQSIRQKLIDRKNKVLPDSHSDIESNIVKTIQTIESRSDATQYYKLKNYFPKKLYVKEKLQKDDNLSLYNRSQQLSDFSPDLVNSKLPASQLPQSTVKNSSKKSQSNVSSILYKESKKNVSNISRFSALKDEPSGWFSKIIRK